MFRGSLFLKTLTSAIVCVALVAGCDSSRKKDLEAQQSQYASQTAKAKEETVKSQNLNRKLEALNAEAETLRNQIAEEKRVFSNQRTERERQLEGILLEIRDASTRLQQLQKSITDIQTQIAEQETVLANLRATQAQEREKVEEEFRASRAALAQSEGKARQELAALQESQNQRLANEQKQHNERIARLDASQKDRLAQMQSDFDEAMRKLRQNFANEQQAKRDQIAKAEADLKARQETLRLDVAEHQASEQALQVAQTALRTAQDNLKKSQEQLAQGQAALASREQSFSANVAAAREFFTRAGQGDVFDSIQNNQVFAFRMSLWGMGSLEKISDVRLRVTSFNQQKGLRKDNAHRELSPVISGQLANTEQRNRISNVDDSFIVTATASEVKNLRDSVNATLAQTSGKNAISSNMWLIARPIKQVRVNLKLSIYGSSDIGFDREQKLIMAFDKVRPLNTAIQGFQNIDITNPGQYVFRANNAAVCERVTTECIKTLKSLGLLDHQSRFTLLKEDGQSDVFTGTYAEYLNKLVDISMTKLHLEDRVKQMMTEGLEITVTKRVVPVERSNWYTLGLTSYTSFEVIEEMDDSSIDDFLKQRDTLENLAHQPVLERIILSYEISMVDFIDGSRDSLDMNKFFFGAGTLDGAELQSLQLENRGEVEIKLPVNLSSLRPSESSFANLSLSDFMRDKAPVALSAAELQSIESLNGYTRMQINNTLADNGNVEDVVIKHLSGAQRTAARHYVKQLQYDAALAAFDTQVLPARENEYSRRRMILFGELNNLKEALK